MSATFQWCERNGASPGAETVGVTNVNLKAVDDTTTAYSATQAIIPAGTNSYTKWQYARFSGSFNFIGNVKYIHQSGIFSPGISLRCQRTMTADSDRLAYSTPSRTASNVSITPSDITVVGSSVTVYIGELVSGSDGAGSSGKQASVGTPVSGVLFTNYLTTQLQTQGSAPPGDTATYTLRIQYDES